MFCRNCGKELSEVLTVCDHCGADSSDPYIGWKIDGRFKIQRRLGTGGMGSVYLAYDQKLLREVAVKILPQDFAQNKEAVARFGREAVITGQISHPNIVFIYDYGTEKSLYYIVMEYVRGERLKDYIDRLAPFPVERIREIGLQICSGLIKTHRQGIIHRDLKPSNIMFSDDGTVKIMDFGIAYAAFNTPLSSGLLGTPHYMSPEQFGGKADQRSDIYALGVMLYQMASGELPFQAENPSELMKLHLLEAPQSLLKKNLDIPLWYEEIVMTCLEKEPELRFPNAYSLEQSLLKRQVLKLTDGERYEERSGTESLVTVLKDQIKEKDEKHLRNNNVVESISSQDEITTEDGSEIETASILKPIQNQQETREFEDTDLPSPSVWSKVFSVLRIVLLIAVICGIFFVTLYYTVISKNEPTKKIEYGYLYVRSLPSGARFKMLESGKDSIYLNSNVLIENVVAGEKRINVFKPGFKVRDMFVTIRAGETTETIVRLDPEKMVVNKIDKAQMSFIPDGEFIMGSTAGPKDEQPLHADNLSGFWIYQYEVTVGQYAQFLNSDPTVSEGNENRWFSKSVINTFILKTENGYKARSEREQYPMIGVSWYGAYAYAKWANGFLPTEAQWEKSARGGLSSSTYPWGDSSPVTFANFQGLLGDQEKLKVPLQGKLGPVPVGSFGGNGYDLFDMAGNVSEWCQDWYQSDFYELKKGVHSSGPDKGSMKILRGGSFLSGSDALRCAKRDKAKPDATNIEYGFRVVRMSVE
jgi:serine/threonine protein kinase/formylglycine-generating enzyme required for sulfatase activity